MSAKKDREAVRFITGMVVGYFLGNLVGKPAFYCFYTLL